MSYGPKCRASEKNIFPRLALMEVCCSLRV